MSYSQVLYFAFLLLGVTFVEGFGVGGYGGGYGGPDSFGYGEEQEKFPPKPYDFGYVANDYGGEHYRNEKGDSSGNVLGSYGYRDNKGLYRKVEYSAGPDGFHASVKTNEPGTDGKEDPADVQLHSEISPGGIQEKHTIGPAYGEPREFGLSNNAYRTPGIPQFDAADLFSGIPKSSGKSVY